jgi:hypothetical protein
MKVAGIEVEKVTPDITSQFELEKDLPLSTPSQPIVFVEPLIVASNECRFVKSFVLA